MDLELKLSDIPDISWMGKLTKEEWELALKRYEEFLKFNTSNQIVMMLVKGQAKLGVLLNDELVQEALVTEIEKDIASDESLPEAVRKQAADDLKEKK